MQKYTTADGRINKLKGEILRHALPVEVLGITGQNKKMPKNVGDTVVYRRWIPFGTSSGAVAAGIDPQSRMITAANMQTYASAAEAVEGVTPGADTLTPVDVTAVLKQYIVMYGVTDKTVDLYEDDVPAEMKKHTGERMGLVREMERYGTLRGMTNAFFAGGTTRATVDETLTLNLLRKVAKSLLGNHGKMNTSILAPSPNFNTKSIEAGYLVFCHTDMEPAIRDLPGFIAVADYGSRKTIHEMEIGSCERFRFILSPELAGYADAGAAIGATGLFSTTGSLIDVYPVIVCGEDAWGTVALRGKNSLDAWWIPPSQRDKSDPAGQRGYIGAKTWCVSVMLNQGWAALIEAGTPSLA
jgi:N4-gp56 family major capsid protein